MNKRIEETVLETGIPNHVLGFFYLCEAIDIIACDHKKLRNMKKYVYIDVARKYQSTVSRVERDIATAIETGCMRSNKMYSYFRYLNNNKGKPTNKEYIATISRLVRK